MNQSYYKSPIGLLEIKGTKKFITSIKIVEKEEKTLENELLKKAKKELAEYFKGSRKEFDIPIKTKGTDFQNLVWEELNQIPYGETTYYERIAKKIGKEKSSRAVGASIHKNPILIVIPCHRVIGKNKSLTGFAYGLEAKEYLLKLENQIVSKS